jgi:hypothetical protein
MDRKSRLVHNIDGIEIASSYAFKLDILAPNDVRPAVSIRFKPPHQLPARSAGVEAEGDHQFFLRPIFFLYK